MNDAKNKNYSVIVASHIKGDKLDILDNNRFSTIDFSSSSEKVDSRVASNIDTFINNGGEFITWLCGHEHYDMIGTLQNHKNQLCVILENEFCDTSWNDCNRVRGTKTQHCFNIMSVDKHSGIFKILRIGNEYDRHLRHKRLIVINYKTK